MQFEELPHDVVEALANREKAAGYFRDNREDLLGDTAFTLYQRGLIERIFRQIGLIEEADEINPDIRRIDRLLRYGPYNIETVRELDQLLDRVPLNEGNTKRAAGFSKLLDTVANDIFNSRRSIHPKDYLEICTLISKRESSNKYLERLPDVGSRLLIMNFLRNKNPVDLLNILSTLVHSFKVEEEIINHFKAELLSRLRTYLDEQLKREAPEGKTWKEISLSLFNEAASIGLSQREIDTYRDAIDRKLIEAGKEAVHEPTPLRPLDLTTRFGTG